MSKFICSMRRGPEMLRANGGVGLQLQVNIYPTPKESELEVLIELILDAVNAYEAKK